MTSRPPCSPAFCLRRARHPARGLAALALLLAAGCSSSSSSTPARTVTGLDLAPATVSVAVHGTQQLTATTTWSDGATENVSASAGWVSSATTTAAVTNGGLVTGQGAGLARIVATYGGKEASRDVTVTAAQVTLSSIAVAPATATVERGPPPTSCRSTRAARRTRAGRSTAGTRAGASAAAPPTPSRGPPRS